MMSSAGWSIRQSTYSVKSSPLNSSSRSRSALPRLGSNRSRTLSASGSGIPTSMLITRVGTGLATRSTKSNRSRPVNASNSPLDHLAGLHLELGDPPRREHARQQLPVHGVRGRVLEEDGPGRHAVPRLDEPDRGSPSRTEGRLVEVGALDVLVARHRVEARVGVVVQRRLVAQAPEDLPRLVRDHPVVRVVDQLRDGGRRHGHLLSAFDGPTCPERPSSAQQLSGSYARRPSGRIPVLVSRTLRRIR